MPPPRRLMLQWLISLFLVNVINAEMAQLNRISVQNSFGEEFSGLITKSLPTNAELVREVLFSQQSLEVSINYGESEQELLCQDLSWSDHYCPVSSSLKLVKAEEDFTFNEQVGDHVCHFMTNRAFNCKLSLSGNTLKVQRRKNNARTLVEVDIFKCANADDLCFSKTEVDIPSLTPSNCTKSQNLNQKLFPVSVTVGGDVFSSVLEDSFKNTITFFEEELTKANMFLTALFKVRIQLINVRIEDNRQSSCRDNELGLVSTEGSAFDLIIDSCDHSEEIESLGELCSSARAAFTLSSVTKQPFKAMLESLIAVFEETECVSGKEGVESCVDKGLVTVESATCGNGEVEAGEECECPEGETECACCSRCVLRENAKCSPFNNECCTATCQFKTVDNFCDLRDSTGYCRLGKCQESDCKQLGYEDFCGLHDDNSCKTKCRISNNDDCLVIDADNALLFVRDGSLCEMGGSGDVIGVCQTGQCVMKVQEKEEPLLSTSNLYLVLGFTGSAMLLAIVLMLVPRMSSRPTSVAHYEGPKLAPQQQAMPNQSAVANPAFVTSAANNVPPNYPTRDIPPLPQKNKTSRKSFRKQKPKQVSVVNTPHRSSKRWNREHEEQVFAIDEDVNSTQTYSTGLTTNTNQSTLKRLSARSKKAPPGLGWQATPPGPGDVYEYVKEELD